jgi:hypothetical protein
VRPQLEIEGGPGERWGLTITEGRVVPVEAVAGPIDGEPIWLPFAHGRIPVKLIEYLDTFTAQHFALLAREGFHLPRRAKP